MSWGFTVPQTKLSQGGVSGDYTFEASFTFSYSGAQCPQMGVTEIVGEMSMVGKMYGWEFLRCSDGGGRDVPAPIDFNSSPTEVTIDLGDAAPHFSHLFERNAQISIVLSAVRAAYSSNFSNRFHVVLEGPPGCGKTAIATAVADMVGDEYTVKFDGPSCSKAGLENYFLGDEVAGPKIMIFEEVEKTDSDALKTLLSILDIRGEVRKTSGNNGQQSHSVYVLCVATANNVPLFEKLHAGALASRFTHKVFCPRPSRRCLEQILVREVKKVVGGSYAWIPPALDYVMGVESCTDPRRAIAVCLSGREKLLDGSYQAALQSIRNQSK